MNTLHNVRHRYSMQTPGLGARRNPNPEKRAQKHFANECNINQIMDRAKRGIMPQGNSKPPKFGDFSGIVDYRTAAQSVIAANEAFMSLPGRVRDRFKNDPQEMLDFCADERNRPEAIELGLIERPAEPVIKIGDEVAK